jgi:hypothetical protein
MSIIREPLDVDFFVIPGGPSKKEEEMISQYIRECKAKQAKQRKPGGGNKKKKPSK